MASMCGNKVRGLLGMQECSAASFKLSFVWNKDLKRFCC